MEPIAQHNGVTNERGNGNKEKQVGVLPRLFGFFPPFLRAPGRRSDLCIMMAARSREL